MSELREALQLAAALPKLKAEALERASKALQHLTISDLHLLADAIENQYGPNGRTAPQFQSANGGLAASVMKQMGVKVRVAVWEMRDGRCEHKQYNVGSTTRAKIGETGDKEWVEAWIA